MRIFPALLILSILFMVHAVYAGRALAEIPGLSGTRAAADDKKSVDTDQAGDLDLENRDINLDKKDSADTEAQKDADDGKKEFVSVRQKKRIFSFHVGFGIGGFGGGILGSRKAYDGIYKIKFGKDAFELGFRGGVNLLFYFTKYHCISLGAYYEQRKARIKITDLYLTSVLLPDRSFSDLYLLPFERYMPNSVVDLNYFTFPVTYRYHVTQEFYLGFGLDVAVIFQAKANYGIIVYDTSVDLRKRFQPVDLAGTILVGFVMNRVFVELAYGAGIMDIDRLPGTRRSMYCSGTIGYRI